MINRHPSARWESYEPWNYGGMKERLEHFMGIINKTALTEHASAVINKPFRLSKPFSAGQFWCCFELVADDETLVIARVRLPRHPDSRDQVDQESERYCIECEVATMKFLQSRVKNVSFPRLYAYAPPGSTQATDVGACYMLIEGFCGNTLQDVHLDITTLSLPTQEHIMSQWASAQAELASCTFERIGSISHFSEESGPTIGRLSVAIAEGFTNGGPFRSSYDYFSAVGEARYRKAREDGNSRSNEIEFTILGPYIFKDIVKNTNLFKQSNTGPFHFNHMDLGTQNILVDDDFNFLAIIDWEFAQTAPIQVNHYPMPFPMLKTDTQIESILNDPDHLAHANTSRQHASQKLYQKKLHDAEEALRCSGRPLSESISSAIDTPASRIYAALEKIGDFSGWEEELTYLMVRLAFGMDDEGVGKYIKKMHAKEGGQKMGTR